MGFLVTLAVFGGCFVVMAIGLIVAKKALKRSCSMDPDECRCAKEGKDPEKCDR